MRFAKSATPSDGAYLEIPSTYDRALGFLVLLLKTLWATLCVQMGVGNEQWATTQARACCGEIQGLAK